MGTKTELYTIRKTPPGEPVAPHILGELNLSLHKSNGKYDSPALDRTLSLPTTINGELDAFRSANQDNIHGNNDEYQPGDNDNDDNDDDVETNDDYDNDGDKTNDYFKVTESMKWVASISRSNALKDVLALSLINMKNHGDNNNNTQNHGGEYVRINNVESKEIKNRKNKPPLLKHVHKKKEKSKLKIRPPLLTRIHRSPLLTNIHDKDEKLPMLNRPPLLTHINEKKEKPSIFTLECNITNVLPNNYDDLINKDDGEEDWDLVINSAKDKKRVITNGEKRSAQPAQEARVCGKLNTNKEDIDI